MESFSTYRDTVFLHPWKFSGSRHNFGIGLLLPITGKESLLIWIPFLDKTLTARFWSRLKIITIVQCYASTEAHNIVQKDALYCQIHAVQKRHPKIDVIVVGGLNAKGAPAILQHRFSC